MDPTTRIVRTAKGHDEIFNQGHTVRPRCRQILFAIGDGIALNDLRVKLPHAELETLLNDLLRGGFVEAAGDAAVAAEPASLPAAPDTPPVAAAPVPATSGADASVPGVTAARDHVLQVLATLAGTKSPAYRKMSEVQDLAGFDEALAMCRKLVAAVASPHQAAAMESGARERLGS